MRKGFTCGAMDLLHAGHLQMLKECRKHCDYLVVGLQTDPSIDRPEKNKPVETIEERMERLLACKYVDDIALYRTEDELVELIKKIQPDVRFLGDDWKGKEFTGKNLPIPIVFTSRDHNYSSSNLRKRIIESETKTAGGFEVYAFDMDGTLTESKQKIDAEMHDLLIKLIDKKKVAVTSGASYVQLLLQLQPTPYQSDRISSPNFFLLPANGSQMFNESGLVYENLLSNDEKMSIYSAFDTVFRRLDIFEIVYGKVLEDRGSQVTYSGRGSDAALELKKAWDPTRVKRTRIVAELNLLLPEFSISIAGTTSVDVTKKGIDKAYGMKNLAEHLGVRPADIFYVGDSLFSGGNDEVVKRVVGGYAEVKNPADTKSFLRHLLSTL